MPEPITLRLLTDSDHPEGSPSDAPLTERLDSLSVPYRWVDWRTVDTPDPGTTYLIRSCWDYHLHPEEFRSVLDTFEAGECRLLNPPSLVRWNLHKRYLSELTAEGFPAVPHKVVDPRKEAEEDVRRNLFDAGWDRVVVKPCVSAGADGLRRLDSKELTRPVLLEADREGVMIQPYRGEIQRGEWSLVGFSGRFRHAVKKVPEKGDFRVQPSLGGQIERSKPEDELVDLFHQVMKRFDPAPVYARLDFILRDEGPEIMELELIEPDLYLELEPSAAKAFVRALSETTSAG